MRALLLKPRQKFSKNELLAFAGVFAVIGGILLIRSFAFYDPTAAVLYHADGNLVQSVGDAKIYLISGGQRHFASLDDFRTGRYNLNEVLPATVGDEQLSVGDPVEIPSGLLVKDQISGQLYLTDSNGGGQVVRRLVNEKDLPALGYKSQNVLPVTDLPPLQGATATVTGAHPDGTKLLIARQIYVISGGVLKTATPDVLSSYNLDKAPVVPPNTADLKLPRAGQLDFADGTLIRGSDAGKVYVTAHTGGQPAKRLIRSPEVFAALGYDYSQVKTVADSKLPALDGLSLPENDGAAIEVSVNMKAGQDGTQLAKNYSIHSNTSVKYAYKNTLALKLPFSDLNALKNDVRVASVSGSVLSRPAYANCNDTGIGPPVPCPIIDSFSASPSTVNYNSPSTLSWSSEYANNCNINGGGVPTTGSQSTGNLTATTGYTLTCNSAQTASGVYSVTAGAGVTVNPPSGGGGGGGGGGANYSSTCDSLNVTLRDNINYVGNCLSTSSSQPDLSQISRPGGTWSGAARSIDVKAGLGTTVSLYSAANYGGACAQYTVDDSDLSTPTTGPVFNQAAVSLKVGSGCPSAPPPPPPAPVQPPINAVLPVITGTLQVGNTLKSSFGQWYNTVTSYNFLWMRCNPDVATNSQTCSNISGATSSSYTLQTADANTALKVRVTANNASGTPVPATSLLSGTIQPAASGGTGGGIGSSCDGNSGVYLYSATNYSGSCQKFTSSSAAAGSWTVGNDKASSIKMVGTYTADLYQDANYGGNFSEFTLSHPDLGQFDIANDTASSVRITSGASTDASTACTNQSLPGVYLYSGAGFSGKCDYFTGIGLRSEKWNVKDNGARSLKINGSYTAILYTGMKLTGSSMNASGNITSIGTTFGTSSIYVAKTGAAPPANTAPPKLTGDTITGSLLTTTTGSWNNPQPTSYQYEWQDCVPNAPGYCTSIAGAKNKTYTTTTNDEGSSLRATVWATNVNGTNYAVSNLIGPIKPKVAPISSAQTLAKQILNNPNITYEGSSLTDMQDAANGKPSTAGAYLSQGILSLIAGLGQGHKFRISALESKGQGHSGPGDLHYLGDAVDITQVDGDPIANSGIGRTPHDIAVIKQLAPVMPKSTASDLQHESGFGQSNCGTTPPLPAGIVTFADACSHLHIQIPINNSSTSSIVQSGSAPVVSADSTSVVSGQSTKLSWVSSGLSDCSGSNGSPGWIRGLADSQSGFDTGPLFHDTTFTLNCLDLLGRNVSQDITVKVTPPTLAQRSPGLAAIGWTSASVKGAVAVVGTGVDQAPGLDVRYSYGPGSDVPDCAGGAGNYDSSADKHDTSVAKLIGLSGDGIDSPAGVAPGAVIVGIRATDINGSEPTTTGIACGIRWAADRGIKVINVSSAAPITSFDKALDFTNCQSQNAEAELSAICYAVSKGSQVVVSAGNYSDDTRNYVPAKYSQAITVTSANEFNGLLPKDPNDSKTAPLSSSQFIINGFSGFCGQGQDGFGQTAMNYSGGKPNFYAAPVCVWLGENVGLNQGYAYGTSYAAAMASGVLLRTGNTANLSQGGAAGKTGGHDYGYELHL